MIIKKIYFRWRLKQIEKQFPFQPYKLNRKLCVALLTELNVVKFSKYDPHIGLSTNLKVRYTNIDDYVIKMKSAIRWLRLKNMIQPTWETGVTEVAISLDRFLVSSNGYYTDKQKSVDNFKHTALRLCELMVESDTAEFGLHEHNARMTTMMFSNIIEVTKVLINTSNKF